MKTDHDEASWQEFVQEEERLNAEAMKKPSRTPEEEEIEQECLC